uniref:Uncharacterized protein n=1 Tax=viral metagenome TaxID=1070528 RepID=A0A6M3L9G7_9ZZZZ
MTKEMECEIVVNGEEYIKKSSILPTIPESETYPYVIGERYYIEQVTKYFTGRLVALTNRELILDQCAWIADTGRYTQAMATGNFNEVEPFPDGFVFVMRDAGVLIRPWSLILPRSQK